MFGTKQLLKARSLERIGSFARSFRKEEDGVMIAFSLFILLLMLIVGGMAVDFMRLEARRSLIQGVADNAVLAAADLDQTLSPDAVVEDYFTKAGLGGVAVNTTYEEDSNYRVVSTVAELDLNTYFLRLIDMDQLGAVAKSTAIEGVGNIEVSLVVDISGSMNDFTLDEDGNETSDRKIDELQAAANSFVTTLLTDDTRDRVSLSFVPYSAHVNAGPDIYNQFNANTQHGFSHCLDHPASAYRTTEISTSTPLEQAKHWQWNTAFDAAGNLSPIVEEPVCPMFDFERIIPLSQNVDQLTAAIAQLEPRGGTAIFMGLKWGVALLDPTIRKVVGNIGSIDSAFTGRPVEYAKKGDPSGTLKYVVLMTDGENFAARDLRDFAYDTPSKIAHWANMNYLYFFYRDSGNLDSNTYTYEQYTAEVANGYMQDICGAAKDRGIIIYGIAMGAGSRGEAEMSKCASSPSHYYETGAETLEDIFLAIAEQITDLRLTQ